CVEKKQCKHADGDHAEISLNLARVRGRHHAAEPASADGGFIDSSVYATLINIARKDPQKLADCGKAAHKAIPEIAIQPVGQTRAHPTERDDRVRIEFVDPHFVCEETKQCGLRIFEWVDLSWAISIPRAGLAIHPQTDANTHTDEHERNKEHRLNQTT